MNKINLKNFIDLSIVENLESLELYLPQNNFDLGKLIIPNIKNLKISSSSDENIKMPFSLLNDLEALILYHKKLEIYSTSKKAHILN